MNEVDVLKICLGVLGVLVWWLWQRNEKRWDTQFSCNQGVQAQLTALQLKIAGELPSSADFEKFSDQIFARLDKLDARVEKINDVVIQLETQAKIQGQASTG